MTFKLEFIRNGDRTLWKGVIDEERNTYMQAVSGGGGSVTAATSLIIMGIRLL